MIFRVTRKSEKKTRKVGMMFDFHAIDSSGEINIVSFPDSTDKFFDTIKVIIFT
jgi:hypothetical protein